MAFDAQHQPVRQNAHIAAGLVSIVQQRVASFIFSVLDSTVLATNLRESTSHPSMYGNHARSSFFPCGVFATDHPQLGMGFPVLLSSKNGFLNRRFASGDALFCRADSLPPRDVGLSANLRTKLSYVFCAFQSFELLMTLKAGFRDLSIFSSHMRRIIPWTTLNTQC